MKQDSWLYSDSFLKRAFAIWGYATVAGLLVMIPLWLVMMIISISIVGSMQPVR